MICGEHFTNFINALHFEKLPLINTGVYVERSKDGKAMQPETFTATEQNKNFSGHHARTEMVLEKVVYTLATV
jgi:hypothetical protein